MLQGRRNFQGDNRCSLQVKIHSYLRKQGSNVSVCKWTPTSQRCLLFRLDGRSQARGPRPNRYSVPRGNPILWPHLNSSLYQWHVMHYYFKKRILVPGLYPEDKLSQGANKVLFHQMLRVCGLSTAEHRLHPSGTLFFFYSHRFKFLSAGFYVYLVFTVWSVTNSKTGLVTKTITLCAFLAVVQATLDIVPCLFVFIMLRQGGLSLRRRWRKVESVGASLMSPRCPYTAWWSSKCTSRRGRSC